MSRMVFFRLFQKLPKSDFFLENGYRLLRSDYPKQLGLGPYKMEPSIFLKIQSEHRQMISSNFLKSFSGADDLVVIYDFFRDFSGVFRL